VRHDDAAALELYRPAEHAGQPEEYAPEKNPAEHAGHVEEPEPE
jgi:hypothetical protein